MKLSVSARGMLAAFFSNFIFGFSFLFSKVALTVTSPLVLLAWRFLVAFAAVNLMLLFGGVRLQLKGKRVGRLLLLGVFQPVLYFICENYGIRETNATFSAVMIALVPVAALAFEALFMGEKPSWLQAIFSVLSVGGVVLMALLTDTGGVVRPVGVILLIGAVVTAVGFNVMSRKTASEFSPFERTYMMFLLASVVFTVLAVGENRHDLAALVTPITDWSFVGALIYLGLLSSVGAFFLINYANTYLPLARTTVFSNVITVVSVFAGAVFLHEPFGPWAAVAAVMIVVGIWGVQQFTPAFLKQRKGE